MKSFVDIYKEFEDRFRGSREDIKTRLQLYRPLLDHLTEGDMASRKAVDLGCGRGEWLDILVEAGFETVGVDVHEDMAAAGRASDRTIELRDALEYLGEQSDGSLALVSAFHVVEHVTTDYLVTLLYECHRVLCSGGLLILETPNPENVSVGTHTFFIDPTHHKPIPPLLLEFLAQQVGFPSTAILRLNGTPMTGAEGNIERSIHLLFEAARDYACLAQKSGEASHDRPEILQPFVQATTQENPADVATAKQWLRQADGALANATTEAKEDMSSISSKLDELAATLGGQLDLMRGELTQDRATITGQSSEITRLRASIIEREASNEQQRSQLTAQHSARIAEKDAEIEQLRLYIDAIAERLSTAETQQAALSGLASGILNSRSWKITAPLRGASHAVQAIIRVPRSLARKGLTTSLALISDRPKTKAVIRRVIEVVPPLARRLNAFAESNRTAGQNSNTPPPFTWAIEPDAKVEEEWSRLLTEPHPPADSEKSG